MGRFSVGGNWAYIDQLDGVEIQSGDMIKLAWPDGTITEHVAIVERGTELVNDMFTKYAAPDHRAYVMIESRGSAVKVGLRKLPEGVEVV